MDNMYDILNDYDSSGERYWYIAHKDTGEVVYTDDGESLHFPSFEDAQEYITTFMGD